MAAQSTSPSVQVDRVHVMGFGRRLGAQIIDALIVLVATFIVSILIALVGLTFQMFDPGREGALQPAFLIAAVLTSVFYYVGFWARQGQTIGKSTLGMTIVDGNGAKPTWGRAILRYVGYMVSSLLFGLGFLWIAFDRRRQGLHDKLAGTYVISMDDDIRFGDQVEFVPSDAGRGWIWLVLWIIIAIAGPAGGVAAWIALGPAISRILMNIVGR